VSGVFTRVLIANRGEIACRIARTARRMGLAAIGVYSDADAGALHVRAMDRAIRIGPAPARESYLSIERVIAAAHAAGAEAVHPGYGFLSENAAFAEACEAAGLVWVGPSPAAMRAMGSKSAAKALMAAAGVPMLAGYHGEGQASDHLAREAARIGAPLVIKAVAGGGGRGMRVVRDIAAFETALAAARQEAASAFGDDRVLIERYLDRARHIEVQVFGDHHGNVVHLFERDCSAQRRHQKVIEEAPAPDLDSATRAAMGEAAVSAARAVGYRNAGTVEFVVDASGFYFLEMNTRLQVEHPVTEAITGLDLVAWQFRIAAGAPLPLRQEEIAASGHAIEARIYAEDPARDFAPSIGRLRRFRPPAEGDGVRVDSGVETGDDIGIHYDPMLAKLICHAPTRAEALGRMRAALAATVVAGVATNLDLLHAIASDPVFAAGAIDTGFIARHAATLIAQAVAPPREVLAGAALGLLTAEAEAASAAAARSLDPGSPWHASDGWWLNAAPERQFHFLSDGISHTVGIVAGERGWRLAIDDIMVDAQARRLAEGDLAVTLDGAREAISADLLGAGIIAVRWRGRTWRLQVPEIAGLDAEDTTADAALRAPLPGLVTAVAVEGGATVRRGEVLVTMEAMKTVFRLVAPGDAVVASVSVRVGDQVSEGQELLGFAPPA